MPKSPTTEKTSDSSRIKVLNAAISCIEKVGPANVTMEEIAAEAGVVRKTVYLAFGNRSALLDAVLRQRLGINVERMQRYVASFDALDKAIVNGSIRHLQLVRKDKLMISLIEHAYSLNLERYFLGPASPAAAMMLTIYEDALNKARARGELRADLSNNEIADWLRGVSNMLLARDDLSPKGQEDLLRKFVLPALIARG